MKKIISIVAVVFLAFAALPAKAQTNSQTTFIKQLGVWITSYNTNNPWTDCLSYDTGIATTTGKSIADRMQIMDNIGNFAVGINGEFVGVGSAFNKASLVGKWYLLNKYDFKMGLTVSAGYDFGVSSVTKKNCMVLNPGLTMSKKITANTFATMDYTYPIETVGKPNTISTIYVGAGFTF